MSTLRYLEVIHLGRLSYAAALKVQEKYARQLLDELSQSKHDKTTTARLQKLLLVEHDPVYTVGIRKKGYSSADVEKLQQLGADFHYTNRGGLITFHGPGQLVVYPIVYLKNFNMGMKSYVCHLEKTVIDTCRHFGINAHTAPDTGVWVGDNKIAAIGIHGSRFVTTHGLALNCDTDLRWFDHIVPCGLQGKGVTSLTKETSQQVTVAEATEPLLKAFIKQFECTLLDQCQ